MSVLKQYVAGQWVPVGMGGILQQAAAPTTPAVGDLWIDTDEPAQASAARDFDVKTRASTSLTGLASTSFADVDAALDLVVTAAAGDVLEIGAMGRSDNTGYLVLTGYTRVGGAPVNNIYGSGDGPPSWGIGVNGAVNISGSVMYTVVTGDIAAGTVTIRMRYKTNGSRTIYSDANSPLQWFAKNIGPNV